MGSPPRARCRESNVSARSTHLEYSGYKASFQQGITEIGCAAHARRKSFDLHANHSSQVAGQALPFFAALYDIERDAATLDAEEHFWDGC